MKRLNRREDNSDKSMVKKTRYLFDISTSPPSRLAVKIAGNIHQPHDNNNPLWQGPCGEGWNGGVTQSLLGRFFTCRERFRLKYILGLEPYDKWNHRLGYGNMWHVCEEAFAKEPSSEDYLSDTSMVEKALDDHVVEIVKQYPYQKDEILKWWNVCSVQFPEYIKYWSTHSDVKNRTPLLQEQPFDVPYTLPSGRVVRLRGKWDSVDSIDGDVWLQENKTKGDIDKLQIERQLSFDLQTMLYLIALMEPHPASKTRELINIKGVRYNVVRRPLSGGKGNISPHKAKSTKKKITPAETQRHFYARLRDDYIAKEPDYWFFRVRAEISQRDIQIFKDTCLDPLLEELCLWYDTVVLGYSLIAVLQDYVVIRDGKSVNLNLNYRTPFGIYNSLADGGETEYDAYLSTGSEVGLKRTEELFGELR